MRQAEDVSSQAVRGARRTDANALIDPDPATVPSRSGNQGIADDDELATLKKQLRELRRQSTLMNAELYHLREAKEELDFQLLKARSDLRVSRERRKEMARIIAKRDAELQVRYKELAALELYILRRSPSWLITEPFRRLRRALRGQAHS